MDIRHSVVLAISVAVASVLAPLISPDDLKVAASCRAMLVAPGSAVNLERPYALRYRSAPVRFCVRDDAGNVRPPPAAPHLPIIALTQ
ncbi:MAG: hypothetical protein QOG83_2451 [Alphaproteobacteria bacterium]|nr:hypothetical protein [Alphaproteobacteria bacterium]